MKHNTNDAERQKEAPLEEKHTCPRGTDNCCTGEATRKKEDTGIERKKKEKQGKKARKKTRERKTYQLMVGLFTITLSVLLYTSKYQADTILYITAVIPSLIYTYWYIILRILYHRVSPTTCRYPFLYPPTIPFFPSLPRQGFCFGMAQSEGGGLPSEQG